MELNCAFLDQARVLLVEYLLNSALESKAGGQPALGGQITSKPNSSGQSGPGSTEHSYHWPGLPCLWTKFEHGSSLAPFRHSLVDGRKLPPVWPASGPTFALFSLVRQCDVQMNETPMVKQLPVYIKSYITLKLESQLSGQWHSLAEKFPEGPSYSGSSGE